MIPVDERTWKAVCQEVSDLKQVNSVDGADCVRTYYAGTVPIARMRVIDCLSDKAGYECERIFEAAHGIVAKARRHYIPTGEEWAEWDDAVEDDEAWLKKRGMI